MKEFCVNYGAIEVTKDGWWGGPADTERQYVRGLPTFTIDGIPVSGEEFLRELERCEER